jgi:hypothetical protein
MGNMRWFFPSWNGDHRLEPNPKDPEETVLIIQKPTPDESLMLDKLGAAMFTAGWISEWKSVAKSRSMFKKSIVVGAPLEKVGPLFVWAFKPGPAVLTAVRFENGKVTCCSDGLGELMKFSESVAKEAKEKDAPKPKAAATVKRPTPSCPDCIPGAIEPASEVLLAFLSPEEHATWAKERAIYVEGGLTGTLYRLAHRHSEQAQRQTRICMDLDAGQTIHFHDTTVPPEEEVLAAKLILEHREDWLRNEATTFFSNDKFKNPFGDWSDGVADAGLTADMGKTLSLGLLRF